MAGPLDSLAAGLGSPAARERFAAERAARAAAAPPPISSGSPISGLVPMSAVGSIPDELGTDSAVGVRWQQPEPDVDLAAMARADMAAEQQAQPAGGGLGMLTGAQAVQGGQAARDRALEYGRLLSATSPSIRANVDYGPTQDYLGATGEAMGRESMAARAIADAEREAAETEAAYYIDEHARMSAEAQAQVDVEEVRAARSEAQVQALQAAEQEIAKAADAFASSPDVDPQRFWTDRSAGQRFAGVLAAAAYGLAGWSPEQATAHIRLAQDADIDAQKFNSGLRERKIGARIEQLSAADRTFERLREHFGDARQAELAMRAARWDEAKARLNAMRASAGLSLQDASHQAMIAAFDKQAAAERFQLARMQARNVPQFVTRVPMLTGGARDVVRALFENDLEQSGKLTAQGLTITSEAASDDAKMRAEAAKEARQDARQLERGPHGVRAELQRFGENTAVLNELQTLVDDFIGDYGDDVPGRGLSSVTDWAADPNRRADAEARLSSIADAIGRLKSGAAITADEQAKFEEWVRAGFGDEQMIANLRNLSRMAEARRQSMERGLSDEARQQFRRTDKVPEFEPDLRSAAGRINRPGGRGGVVAVDE